MMSTPLCCWQCVWTFQCNPQTWIQCAKDQAQQQIEKRLSQRVQGSDENAKSEETFDTFE